VIETHQYSGLWWLPADESKKLSGTLTLTRGEGKLDVLHSFGHEVLATSEDETIYSPFPASVPRILGMTTTGKEITLEACDCIDSAMHFPGIPTTTYRPQVTLLGGWFTDREDVLFDEIAVRTTELDTWASVSGFSQKISGEEQPETGRFFITAVDIHFDPPDSISIPLDDGMEAKIDFTNRHAGMSPVMTEISLSQAASLYLRYANPQSIDGAIESVIRIRNFLSLAVGRPVTVLSVTGFKDDFPRSDDSLSHQPVEIVWPIPHNPDPPQRSLHPVEMLFTLPEARPSISDVMRAWFSPPRPFFVGSARGSWSSSAP
jgi:hypothetical protein